MHFLYLIHTHTPTHTHTHTHVHAHTHTHIHTHTHTYTHTIIIVFVPSALNYSLSWCYPTHRSYMQDRNKSSHCLWDKRVLHVTPFYLAY